MTAAAAPYTGWLSQAASHASAAAAQARAVVSAFEAAQAATVQPILVALNRNSLVQMVMSNWFGLNAPAIASNSRATTSRCGPRTPRRCRATTPVPLPRPRELSPAQTLQDLLASLPNLGIGNKGNANLGNGNTGIGNIGGGDAATPTSAAVTASMVGRHGNIGSGNHGNSNLGVGNSASTSSASDTRSPLRQPGSGPQRGLR